MSRKSALPQPAQSVMSADGGQLRVLGVAFAGASCEIPLPYAQRSIIGECE